MIPPALLARFPQDALLAQFIQSGYIHRVHFLRHPLLQTTFYSLSFSSFSVVWPLNRSRSACRNCTQLSTLKMYLSHAGPPSLGIYFACAGTRNTKYSTKFVTSFSSNLTLYRSGFRYASVVSVAPAEATFLGVLFCGISRWRLFLGQG